VSGANWIPVQLEVNSATIASGDPYEVINPIWWTASFYDDLASYEESLRGFSKQQRHVWAVLWYCSEVHNGGHDQFFDNSTGVVWPDALEGLIAIERSDLLDILMRAVARFSLSPSREGEERREQMSRDRVTFDELDPEFWNACRAISIDKALMDYIRSQPEAFYFSGVVRRPKPKS